MRIVSPLLPWWVGRYVHRCVLLPWWVGRYVHRCVPQGIHLSHRCVPQGIHFSHRCTPVGNSLLVHPWVTVSSYTRGLISLLYTRGLISLLYTRGYPSMLHPWVSVYATPVGYSRVLFPLPAPVCYSRDVHNGRIVLIMDVHNGENSGE